MRKIRGRNILNYIIVALTILFNCSPFFLFANRTFWLILFSLLTIITLITRKRFIHQKIFAVLAAAWILIIIQSIAFGGFSPAVIYFPILVFYTPFLVFSIMGISYFKYLFKIIYFIALYTSIIYLLQVFVPEFNTFLSKTFEDVFPYSWADWPRSILIYSIPRESGYFLPRNSGIFHEPGAYSIYLILAIIINTILSQKAINGKNIFLSLVLLSTFSTIGYLMLFFILAYSIWSLKLKSIFKVAFLLLYLSFSLGVFQNYEFLQKKVSSQYTENLNAFQRGERRSSGRFYNIAQGIKTFLSNPLLGRGIITGTVNDESKEGIGGSGFLNLFARFGIIFGIFYMWFFYKGLRVFSELFNATKLYIILVFIVLNVGLLSQGFFFHISFVMFFIVGLLYPAMKRVNTGNYNTFQSPFYQNSSIKKSKPII